MPLYQSVTVAESRQVVLENLPYAPGERVDVVVLPQNPEYHSDEVCKATARCNMHQPNFIGSSY